MTDDYLDPEGPISDEPLDRPELRCSCCGRRFRPTFKRRMLCAGCFHDAVRHETWLSRGRILDD